MTSIEIKDFEATLRNFINDYELPAEVKRYVLKDILLDVTRASQEEMIAQAQERDSQINSK